MISAAAGGESTHGVEVDGRGPGLVRIVEPGPAAEQRDIATPPALEVPRFAAGGRPHRHPLIHARAGPLQDAERDGFDVGARGLQARPTVSRADVGAEVEP